MSSPWLSIWCHPRATIQRIVAENPNRSLWLLAAIYGFSSGLNLAQSISLGGAVHVFFILILALLIAPVWGYLVFSIWSWLVFWSGKLLKGQGEFRTVRAAYAWSCVPLIVNVALWLVLAGMFGGQIFFSAPDAPFTGPQVTFLFFILIAKVVLAIWSLVIYLNTLAQVQRFSVLRAIGNVVIAAIVCIVILSIFWVATFKIFGLGLPLEQPMAQMFFNYKEGL